MLVRGLTSPKVIQHLYFDTSNGPICLSYVSDGTFSNILRLPLYTTQIQNTFVPRYVNVQNRRFKTELEKYRQEQKYKHLKIRVTLPTSEQDKVLIYTIYCKEMKFIDWIIEKRSLNDAMIYKVVVAYIEYMLSAIKNRFPNHVIVFHHLNPNSWMRSFWEYVARNKNRGLLDLKKDIQVSNIFVAVPTTKETDIVIPLCFTGKSGDTCSIKMLPYIFYELPEDASNVEKKDGLENKIEVAKSLDPDVTTKPQSIDFNKIINKVEVKVSKNKTDYIHRINVNEFTKQLRKIGIKDQSTIATITDTINYLINANKIDSEDDINRVVYKILFNYVYGRDPNPDEYIPVEDLIRKLSEIGYYKTKISLVPAKEIPIDPNNVVDLKHSTSAFRHKIEFNRELDKNIMDLFRSLESVPVMPIKVLKIEKKEVDDPYDKYIEYVLTLKNVEGGYKRPYTVSLKIPKLINDRYFYLKGKIYSMANQLHLHPITKTRKNEVRFLTAYAPVTVSLTGVKYGYDDIKTLLTNFVRKYKDAKQIDETTYKLGNTTIYLSGDKILEDSDKVIKYKDGQIVIEIKGKEVKTLNRKVTRNEIIYDFLSEYALSKGQNIVYKSSRSNPTIQVYISGIRVPLLLLLASRIGLDEALRKLDIQYEITDKRSRGSINIPLEDGRYISIPLDKLTTKQRLILNCLTQTVIKKLGKLKSPSDVEPWRKYLIDKYGEKGLNKIYNVANNCIDKVTKDLLRYAELPTNFDDLLVVMTDKLINDPVKPLHDLSIYRARLAEMLYHIVYKQLVQAHAAYANKAAAGEKDAKISLVSDYVINNLLQGSGILMNLYSINPVEELMRSVRVIKTGPGGVPSKRMLSLSHRNIDPTHLGNLALLSTSEYGDVGIQLYMTTNPKVINRYGFIATDPDYRPWNLVAWDEGLIPFNNGLDATRAIMATTHLKQTTPISNSQPPLVMTGMEYVIPRISSQRFIINAEDDGVIQEVTDKYVKVKYNKLGTKYYNIIPRIARTKRSAVVNLVMKTRQKGEKISKGEAIAWTENFAANGNIYAPGTNVRIAVMNYLGYNHEDGYVVSQSFADSTEINVSYEEDIIIPPRAKVVKLLDKIGYESAPGETLVEITYSGEYDYDSDDEEQSSILQSQNTIKLVSPGGKIIGIEVYINNPRLVDKKVVDLWKKISKEIQDQIKITGDKDNINTAVLKVGDHKRRGVVFEGARVVYYVQSTKTLQVGDKLSNRYGAKGIIAHIIPLDLIPYSETFDEIDVFISPLGIAGRKNIVFIKEIYLGKIMYFLNKRVKDMIKEGVKTSKILDLIFDIIKNFNERQVKSMKNFFKEMTSQEIRRYLENSFIPAVVPPYHQIDFDKIEFGAKTLGIPLDEKVFIPALNAWTKNKVPVGISYYFVLEHYGYTYISARGAEGYSLLTGQPLKGKREGGGAQALGNLDMYALLAWGADNLLQEFITARSDDPDSRLKLIFDIIRKGETNLKSGGRSKSIDYFNTLMKGMHLSTEG